MIHGLKKDEIPDGAFLEINGETGQVWLVKGGERELAFHYHDMGYIHLAPCVPFVRSLEISHVAGKRAITSSGGFTPAMEGQYVFLAGEWMDIRHVDDANTAQLRSEASDTGTTGTPVVTMNKIRLWGDAVVLSHLEIEYVPRVQ